MNFNFDATAGISQSNSTTPLVGNKIHDVIFDGCEARDFDGVKDPSAKYSVLEMKFHNEDGSFTHTIWAPKDTDFEDTESQFGKNPSNVKSMMLLFKHLIDAVNPELGKQIDSKEKSLNAPNWNKLRELMVKATESGIGKEISIKLLVNKKGEAIFPGFFASYSRKGELYMRTNFIGEKGRLFFSSKELEKIKNAEKATPTPIKDELSFTTESTEAPAEVPGDDLNFNF